MTLAKKLKQIVKGDDKPTFGTDPNDPWSVKSNITESGGLSAYLKAKGINPQFISKDTKISHAKSSEFAKWKRDHQFEEVEYVTEDKLLDSYLKSRGLNPLYVTKDQKIAHAKSSAFLSWKRNHMNEQVFQHTPVQKREHMLKRKQKHGAPIQTEETDQKDTITLDIPFMIRVLEYAREDAKDDMALHKVVEKLIEIRNKGTLTMDDYNFVTQIKEHFDLSEGAMKDIATDREEKSRLSAQERGGADAWYGRKYKNPHEVGSIEHKAYHQGFHGGEKGGKDYGTPKAKPLHSFRESALERFRQGAVERLKKHDEIEKKRQTAAAQGKTDVKGAIDRLEKSLNKESIDSEHAPATHAAIFHDEHGKLSYIVHFNAKNDEHAQAKAKTLNVLQRKDGLEDSLHRVERIVREEVEKIDELKKSTVKSWLGKQDVIPPKKPGMDRKAYNQRVKTRSKSWDRALDRMTGHKPTSEDVFQDSQAATQTNFDGANAPDNTEPVQPGLNRKREMSKSARIIKSIYKKKGVVKEETYDHEKEDKSVASYGKKPKMQEMDKDNMSNDTIQAAAVLSGGKTLTGQARDTLAIDPLMKRPLRFDAKK